jgi:nuclear cap-binding protein subunit 1
MVCPAAKLVMSKLINRIPDLELPSAHPRRAFIRKVVDSEVRLAYHDRILQTLPEPMQAKEAEVIGEDPQPNWPYEREGESTIHPRV